MPRRSLRHARPLLPHPLLTHTLLAHDVLAHILLMYGLVGARRVGRQVQVCDDCCLAVGSAGRCVAKLLGPVGADGDVVGSWRVGATYHDRWIVGALIVGAWIGRV
jgi:hypothetical protein